MKGKNDIKKKKRNSSGNLGGEVPIIFSLGFYDFTLTINFSEEDLKSNGIKFSEIKELKDLKFISNKKEIIQKIELSSSNNTINELLLINKCSKKLSYIEYIPFSLPKFSEEEKFFEDILTLIIEKNNLILNREQIIDDGRFSLIIILKYKSKEKIFQFGKIEEEVKKEKDNIEKHHHKKERRNKEKENKKEENENEENDEEKKEENENEKEENEEEKKNENEEEKKNENEEEKKSDNTNEKKEEKKQENQNIENKNINNEEEEEENEEPNESNLTEAQKLGKIPVFKNKKSPFNKMNPNCTKYDLVYINFIDIENLNNTSFKYYDLIQLLIHFKIHNSESPITFISYPELSNKEGKDLKDINDLFYLTDIFFFDTKDASKTFDKHYKYFNNDKIKNEINGKNIFDYFIKGIATATRDYVDGIKVGLFLSKFSNFDIIISTAKKSTRKNYECQPYPKINHTNFKLINEYKQMIKTNTQYFYSLFIGGILNVICPESSNSKYNCLSLKILYPAFLTGLEMLKRVIELKKNDLTIPNNGDFYIVKISKKMIDDELNKEKYGNKEDGFILDCINKEKSTMKDYVALYDNHLKSFFSSEVIKKDLINRGFINEKGFIMYDPVYRSVMGSQIKNNQKNYSKDELNKKLFSSIKGINVGNNYKDKEINAKKMVMREKSPLSKKLPVLKDSDFGNGRKSRKSNRHKEKNEKNEKNQNEKPEEYKEEEENPEKSNIEG